MKKSTSNDNTKVYTKNGNSSTKKKPSRNTNKNGANTKEMNDNNKGVVTNSPTWYSQYPEMLTSAGTYNFSTPVGLPINVGPTLGGKDEFIAVPGIARLNTTPFPGISKDVNSPINIQAKRLYTYMRAKRSGSSSYDPADVMLYVLAVDSAYNLYCAVKRILGTIGMASMNNRYYPEMVCSACGGSYDNILKNRANLTTYLQGFVQRLATLYIPANMTYFMRHSTLFSNIYVDKSSPKGQLYVFNLNGVYIYDETSTPGTAILKWQRINGELTYDAIVTLCESVINPLLASGDINQMSVDMFNTFGDSLYTVEGVDMGYTFSPVYDLEMLNQIQNATIIGDWNPTNIKANPDTGLIETEFVLDSAVPMTAKLKLRDLLLNVQGNFTNPEYVMTSTRLMVKRSETESGTAKIVVDSCGSEVITTIDFLQNDYNPGDPYNPSMDRITLEGNEIIFARVPDTADVESSSLMTGCATLSVCSTFDYHPAVNSYFEASADNAYPTYIGTSFNFDYFTTLDGVELKKLHNAALLSEFYVPLA